VRLQLAANQPHEQLCTGFAQRRASLLLRQVSALARDVYAALPKDDSSGTYRYTPKQRDNGLEGYWTTLGVEWLIYASHESTLTVAGTLLDRVKGGWPTWARREIKPIW
jgi:pyrrolidone-carboxylate peptidase